MSENIIDRRTLIRNFLVVSAGIVFLPACVQNEGKASIALKNITLTAADEATLAALCETLIPATDTPGSKDINLHLFVMKMIDDCYPEKDQEKLLKGMRLLEDKSQESFDASFAKCTPAQRAGLVKAMEQQKKEDEMILFYTTVKKLAIQGFTNSQYYLTKVRKYELVPGRFHGCVPVTPSSAGIKTV